MKLGNSAMSWANENSGASLEPMEFKHILSNQRIARSVVTNGQTNLCLSDALYIGLLGA